MTQIKRALSNLPFIFIPLTVQKSEEAKRIYKLLSCINHMIVLSIQIEASPYFTHLTRQGKPILFLKVEAFLVCNNHLMHPIYTSPSNSVWQWARPVLPLGQLGHYLRPPSGAPKFWKRRGSRGKKKKLVQIKLKKSSTSLWPKNKKLGTS